VPILLFIAEIKNEFFLNKKIYIYIFSKNYQNFTGGSLEPSMKQLVFCVKFSKILKTFSKRPPKKHKKILSSKITNILLEVALNTLTRILLESFKNIKIVFF